MKMELATLESMGAWEVVDRDDSMNVIDLIWAIKCERFPDGLIKKFKARFCARGFVPVAINNLKGLTSSKLMCQWCNGPLCA